MKKIMFNDKYGLTAAVLNGEKTMTRRIIPIEICNATDWKAFNEGDMKCYGTGDGDWVDIRRCATYKIGEVIAVAQAYKHIVDNHYFQEQCLENGTDAVLTRFDPGWDNKMFVKSYYMPHRIRITDIKVERLQDISEVDCLREGIEEDSAEGSLLYWWSVPHEGISWEEYKKRCYELSRHDYKGKPGSYYWETPQDAFARLVDKVSGEGTWESNPWVFAYTFKLID